MTRSTATADKIASLTELDKDEFRYVARKIDPKLTDEEFERAWAEFVELKRKRSLN